MANNKERESVRVGLVQMTCAPEPEPNMEKAVARVREAASKGAQVVCLQELFRSQYFCQTKDIELFKLAEPIPGPSTEALGRLARQKKIVIVASLFERRAPGLYHNTAVIIDAHGRVAGKYRKMHIPDDPLYYEKFYFTQGDLGFASHDKRYGRVGTLVCWDQWFPEAARLTALSGAQFLFYPTAASSRTTASASASSNRRRSNAMTSKQTPAALGYRMPPEWHRHAATWLTWPKDPLT